MMRRLFAPLLLLVALGLMLPVVDASVTRSNSSTPVSGQIDILSLSVEH